MPEFQPAPFKRQPVWFHRADRGLAAMFPDASPQYKARLLDSDAKVLDAMRVDSLGFADILASMTMPCLVYAGTADSLYPAIEETVAEMPNVTFFSLSGLGHGAAMVHSELVLSHIIEFLARVNSEAS